MAGTTVPLKPIPESGAAALDQFGAPQSTRESKLYQALGNDDELLTGWISFAWRLRSADRRTPTRLRELMIVLAARLQGCAYEEVGHTRRALAAGVSEVTLAVLGDWRQGSEFTAEEQVALALVEEMIGGHVSDETLTSLEAAFDESQRVEVILTAGFYCMSPRVIDALRLEP